MKKEIVFWDVDTQFDFMMPEGGLYVPGAETIIDKISQIRKFAFENGYSIIADIDWHSTDNAEISDNPDYKATFPPHCIAGSSGCERVGYLGELPIEYIENKKISTEALKQLVNKNQFHIVIRKQSLDAFENPNTDRLIKLVKPQAMAVFGVALDFCVYYVLRGLAKYPDIKLYLLMDAVKSLGARQEEEILYEFRQNGVEITEFEELKRQL